MLYIEELESMKSEEYTFNGDATWYVSNYTPKICYCSSEKQCYHYKIKSRMYDLGDGQCSFKDRFKPKQYIRFTIPMEEFNKL